MSTNNNIMNKQNIFKHYHEFPMNLNNNNSEYTADNFEFHYDVDFVMEKGHEIFEIVPNFKTRYDEEINKPGAYNNSKLLLRGLKFPKSNVEKIQMHFGTIKYFEWLILRDWVTYSEDNPSAKHSDELQKYLKENRSSYESAFNQNESISNCMWGMCGCGAWVVTSDNKLAYSKRSQAVRERPGSYGYSSAGGCDRFVCDDNFNSLLNNDGKYIDNNPFITIQSETSEELGVTPNDYAEPLKLISFGIDKTRALIQFSFFIKLNIDSETLKVRAQAASSAWEQKTFLTSFNFSSIEKLLTDQNYSMEPGAKVSLYHCMMNYC